MILASAALLVALLSGAVAPAPRAPLPIQEAQGDEQAAQLKKIDRYLELAKSGRVPVRPQAARRLVKLGAPAARRVLEECGADGAGLVDFGPYLVEVLGDFEEPRLRELLWRALAQRDFPWRAPAARSLAQSAVATERAAFLELSRDPVAQVRRAAVGAFGAFDPEDPKGPEQADLRARLRELTADPDEGVRREAAAQLDAWGEHAYLMWLVWELKRTDTYFRMPLGERARFEALRTIEQRLGDDFGYRAEDSPETDANRAAFERIRAAVLERAGGAELELPAIAEPGQRSAGDRIGLELRSCRSGDLFLRWNASDVLYVGTSRPCAVALPQGSVARLEAALGELAAELGQERYWGEAGCDTEQLRLAGPEERVEVFLVSKGQAAVPNLRPEPLDRVLRLLLETLPEGPGAGAGDPRADGLRRRVRESLLLLGGEYLAD